ncbi:MAG: hypothetical protein RBS07_15385 [Lentimicrobium sp.]|jgi:hypothetical protein|nr:hypothetical protein [Lentimicrobium sp.]
MGKTFNAIIKAGYHTLGFPPISRVELNKSYILLNGFLYGNYCLAYNDIEDVIITDSFLIGFLSLKITHSIQNYPQFTITLGKAKGKALYESIMKCRKESKVSIMKEGDQFKIKQYQEGGKNPVKKGFQIIMPMILLIPVLLDLLLSQPEEYFSQPFGIGTISAFTLAFAIGFAILFSISFRIIFLKPGRILEDINRSVYSILLFLSFCVLGLLLMQSMV